MIWFPIWLTVLAGEAKAKNARVLDFMAALHGWIVGHPEKLSARGGA